MIEHKSYVRLEAILVSIVCVCVLEEGAFARNLAIESEWFDYGCEVVFYTIVVNLYIAVNIL